MVAVSFGGPGDFNALLYGSQQHPGTVSYLQRQMETLSNVSHTFTEAGRNFVSHAKSLYDQFNSAESVRLAKAALRRAGSVFQRNEVREMWDIHEIQNAPTIMQRWIMAEPTVRQMYFDQRIDGYADSYHDHSPGVIGKDHYDYRQATNGMVMDISEEGWKYNIYLDDLMEGDSPLSFDERTEILSTWDMIRHYVKNGNEDPTSVFASKM